MGGGTDLSPEPMLTSLVLKTSKYIWLLLLFSSVPYLGVWEQAPTRGPAGVKEVLCRTACLPGLP